MCLYHIFLVHSPVGRCLNCSHNLAFMNMLNIVIHIWISAFNSFEAITGSGIGGLYGNSMFNFFRNCQTVFHNGCTGLHLHQLCGEFYFPTSLLICYFPSRCEVISHCDFISLMTNNVEHIFMCFLAHGISSLEK